MNDRVFNGMTPVSGTATTVFQRILRATTQYHAIDISNASSNQWLLVHIGDDPQTGMGIAIAPGAYRLIEDIGGDIHVASLAGTAAYIGALIHP